MAGYYGYKMSNNALQAYSSGEMPLSKWSKEEILSNLPIEKAEIAKKLTLKELRNEFLEKTSWHHTSKMYNCTDFYSINEEAVEEFTEERVSSIIECRPEKTRKSGKVQKQSPLFVTALISYSEWEGSKKHPKLINKEEIVRYMSNDKMIDCAKSNSYKKRLSSVKIIFKVELKTKHIADERLLQLYQVEKKKQLAEKKEAEKKAKIEAALAYKKEQEEFEIFEKAETGTFDGFKFVNVFHEKFDKSQAVAFNFSNMKGQVIMDFGTFNVDRNDTECYFFSKAPTKIVYFNRSIYLI